MHYTSDCGSALYVQRALFKLQRSQLLLLLQSYSYLIRAGTCREYSGVSTTLKSTVLHASDRAVITGWPRASPALEIGRLPLQLDSDIKGSWTRLTPHLHADAVFDEYSLFQVSCFIYTTIHEHSVWYVQLVQVGLLTLVTLCDSLL